MTKYRIRIAIVAGLIGLVLGWNVPIWTKSHVLTKTIDGRIQKCLLD